jgi:copper chaperone CopZ
MKNIKLELPAMYGDHHVQEVRRILSELDGVNDIYASSGFRMVEVSIDPDQVTQETVEARLAEAGYTGELDIPMEEAVPATEAKEESYFRHTSAYAQTKNTVGFKQRIGYEGRPLWPCPGIGPLSVNPLEVEKESSDG